ncbi:MAG: hypothetical protein CMK63_10445 [Pseudoalteromonadaceae bacterium]|nr:hypothetical protein [Pseudoalteromonadaceae bacterium]|tara:strand:+ start:62 stop:1123 length:1062 start_codon:yes stop_codon:yes gene_type:complete
MIKCIDLLSYNSSHVGFNSCILKYIKEEIHYVSESKHMEAISEKLNKPISRKVYKRGRFWKYIRDFYFVSEVFKSGDYDKVIILGATGTQLFLLSLIMKIFKTKREKIRLFYHSELEFLDNKKGINKLFARFAVKSFKLSNLIKTAVLSEHIKMNMLKMSDAYAGVKVVRHPMPSINKNFVIKRIEKADTDEPRYKLAVIGLLRGDTKDLNTPIKLRNLKSIDTNFFGRLGPESDEIELSENCKVVKSHYTDDWLKSCLEGVDFLLLSPLINSYKYTALGTVSDSTEFSLPLVWIEHEALKSYESFPLACVVNDYSDFEAKVQSYEIPSIKSVSDWVDDWNHSSKKELDDFIR